MSEDVQKNISESSGSYSGSIIALALNNGNIIIWDLHKKQKVCQFESVYDTGGKRLAISENGNYCAVGAYHIYGIAMYNSKNGEKLWQRKDLKKVQRLYISRHRDFNVVACFDNKSMHILDKDNGKTIEKIKAVRDYDESDFNDYELHFKCKNIEIRKNDNVIFKIPKKTVLIRTLFPTDKCLIVANSSNYVNIYNSIIKMHCINIVGQKEQWCFDHKGESFIVSLGYCSNIQELMAIAWNSSDGSYITMLAFNIDNGQLKRKKVFKRFWPEGIFALNGNIYINNTGQVIDTKTFDNLYRIDTKN